MVDGVMIARLIGLCGFCLMAGAMPVVGAELNDPTRPPPGYSQKALAQPRTQATSADPVEAVQVAAPNRISSLFLMGDKPYAVVDGVIVRLGDPLAEGRVSRIDVHGVWIKTSQGIKQLKWLPDIVKTPPTVRMEKK
jgi:hypothetical protein